MYLSLSLCAFQERGHSQREKALSWERKQFLYPLARVYLNHTHNAISNASLSLTLSRSGNHRPSLPRSAREKRRRIFSVFWLLSLSRSLSRTFSSISKKLYHVHTLLSHSLSHTRTQTAASREDETMVYYCSTFCA